jgi:hypothetical protein
VTPFRLPTRRRDEQSITADADLSRLALRNATLATPTDPRGEPVVAVLLGQAVEAMSRRFRDDDAVAAALRTRTEAEANLAAAASGRPSGTGGWHGAPVGAEVMDVVAVTAEVEQARAARTERQARAALGAAQQQEVAAEREVVDALTAIARRTLVAANAYLATLNTERADLGRRAVPLLDEAVIDELFSASVRQPRASIVDPEEA